MPLGHENIFARHCKAAMTCHLRTQGNLRVVQQGVYQDAGPHDVRLVYDAHNPSGQMVGGEFRCLYVPVSGGSSSVHPQLRDVELHGARLTVGQRILLDVYGGTLCVETANGSCDRVGPLAHPWNSTPRVKTRLDASTTRKGTT